MNAPTNIGGGPHSLAVLRSGRSAGRVSRRGSQAGFSLMEFLVAFAIVGIIVAIAMMQMGPMARRYAARSAAREIHGVLQNARMRAVAENNRFRFLLVGGSNHQYKVHDDSDGDGVEDVGEPVATYSIQDNHLEATLAASGAIVFTTNGTAPTPGTVTISHPGGNSIVNVSSAGRIRLQ